MTQHFVVKCKECGDVITQCRCPAPDKTVTLSTCDNCKREENLREVRREMLADNDL